MSDLVFITVYMYINNEICSNQQCIGISQVLVTSLDVNDRNVVPYSKLRHSIHMLNGVIFLCEIKTYGDVNHVIEKFKVITKVITKKLILSFCRFIEIKQFF